MTNDQIPMTKGVNAWPVGHWCLGAWSLVIPFLERLPMPESYSPGLEGIIAGETSISTVDTGLTYRGYAIEDLAEHSTYEEVAYLILYGELPTTRQASEFRQRLGAAASVPKEIIEALRHIPKDAPSMDVLR